ncbi:cytochrome P450 [Promicromonospora sukumoe]|uniref:cytochrome P450 n=1 Tax=Promicromonospora sukumoe TaxID=88382 RepID=UPI0036523857
MTHRTIRYETDSLTNLTGLVSLTALTSSPDPQAAYDALRARWGAVAPVEIEAGVPGWLVMGHQESCHVMRSEAAFAKDPRTWRWNYEDLLPPGTAIATFAPADPRPSSFHHDGEERRRLRKPLDDALEALDERTVRDSITALCVSIIDRMGPSGTTDLVRAFCQPMGFLAMTTLLGFDLETGAQLMTDSAKVVVGDGDEVAAAQARVAGTILQHIQQRRQDGGQDLISFLAIHQNFAHDGEIASTAVVPMHAAAIFLTAWITQTLHLRLSDRQLASRVNGGRVGLDDALDEVLWRQSPIAQSPALRFARNDVELGGRIIAKGDALVLSIAAANGDPAVHTSDPWDEVGNRAHLSWGTGPHSCPAPRQARLIARIAVDQLLRHMDVQLHVPEEGLPWAHSPWVRHPERMPVTYRRATAYGDVNA